MVDAPLIDLVTKLSTSTPDLAKDTDACFVLAKALENEPEFSTQPMIVAGSIAHGWNAQFAAQKMFAIVRSGRPALAAVAWFRKMRTVSQSKGGAIKWLYGIECSKPIPVNKDIVLLPYGMLPKSEMIDSLVADHQQANDFPWIHGVTILPSAALFRKGVVEPIFHASLAESWHTKPPSSWFKDLHDAERLLALIPKAVPVEAAHWLHFDDPDVALLVQTGRTRQVREIFPTASPSRVDVKTEDLDGVFDRYQQLNQTDRNRIDLALERIIRSRSQFVTGNRAIDLAIGLEVLFMTEKGEHSYKISLRAAKLLRSANQPRKKTFLTVRSLYNMRSSMVHTGNADNKYDMDGVKISAHEIVENVDLICIEAIRKFFAMGRIPSDWREIELS